MKIRRAICLVVFLGSGLLALGLLWDMQGLLIPQPPEIRAYYLALMPAIGLASATSLCGLYGAWRTHQAIGGRPFPSRGPAALLDALVWLVFAGTLAGFARLGALLFLYLGVNQTVWQLSWLIALAAILAGSALYSLWLAYRAWGRRRLLPFSSDLE